MGDRFITVEQKGFKVSNLSDELILGWENHWCSIFPHFKMLTPGMTSQANGGQIHSCGGKRA